MASEEDARMGSLLRQLATLAPRQKVKDEITHVIDQLEPIVEQHGLNPSHFKQCIELALGGHLITSHALPLLSLLLPRQPISSQPVLRILSVLGEPSHIKPQRQGRIEYKVQVKALQHLVVWTQLGALDRQGRNVLRKYWGVIARGLEYGALRDVSAQLLCLVTRRVHVQEYRIAHLQSTIRKTEQPPASLYRLLDLFRSYYPELVFTSSSKPIMKATYKSAALETYSVKVRELLTSKRRRTDQAIIPLGATFDAGTLAKLVNKLDLPSNAAGVLRYVPGATSESQTQSEEDRSKVWGFLSLCAYGNDPGHIHRLGSFVSSSLSHELHDLDETADGEARVEDLLVRVRAVCELAGEVPEDVEIFLAEFLCTWAGDAHRQVVFELVALLKPTRWELLYSRYLEPLQQLIVSATDEWLADLLSCLANLIENWATRDDWQSVDSTSAFGQLEPLAPYIEALQCLIDYGDRVATAGAQTYPTSSLLRSASLGFYESVLRIPIDHSLAVVIIPAPTFAYLCLLSDDVGAISRMCGLITTLREALTGEATAIPKHAPVTAELVTCLNELLVDFVNAIWQKRFLGDQQNAIALGLTKSQVAALKAMCDAREQSIAISAGITLHPAFIRLAREHLSQLDPSQPLPEGPITLTSLKRSNSSITFADFRISFLDFLKDHAGAKGLHEFLFTSLQSLITRRQSLNEASQS